MRVLKIAVVVIVVVLAAALIAGGLVLRSVARKALPDYNATISLERLTDQVVVYRDARGIPHVFAKNEPDLYRAVGYCMAQDRMWQMDLLRRACEGRLAEIFGKDLVDIDLLLRSLRIPEKSRMMLERADPAMLSGLDAFRDGVNQYIRDYKDKLPPEFTILSYVPEEWKPEHSAHLVSYMAWDLTFAWHTEVALHKVLKKVGEKRFKEILPDFFKGTNVIYPDFGDKVSGLDLRSGLLAGCQRLDDLGIAIFQGSNNWAVSGKKSVTGKPLLANDMHLGLFSPGIWYPMHQVVEGKLDITGVALPGTPTITAGHNKHIAWGFTNVMVDDLDFYLEKVNPDNPNQYRFKDVWKNFEIRKEQIKVKGGEPVTKELRFTHRGPVISEFQNVKDEVISMRWIGNEYSNELRSIYLLNRAKNWEDFKDALKTFSSVSQNVVYADVEGNIGLYCAAGVPIRKAGDGISIMPGWTDEYDWKGFVPFEKLPHSYNPESGYVVSANNKTVDERYPYYISMWYALPSRYDRIKEMLTEKDKLSIDDFKRIQTDHKSALAASMKNDIVAEVKRSNGLTPLEKQALELFATWDCDLSRTSQAASLFEVFFSAFVRNAVVDEIGKDLFDEFNSKRFLSQYAVVSLWKNRDSEWFDDVTTGAKKETFTDIVQKSFKDAVKLLKDRLGDNPKEWQWGKIHQLVLDHPLGSVKILDRLFKLNRGPFPVGGSFHTVSPYSYKFQAPFKADHGASERFVFSLGNWDDSQVVIPTGVSGIPASDHYCDLTNLYVEGKYIPDYVSRDLIEKNAKYKMVIRPAGTK